MPSAGGGGASSVTGAVLMGARFAACAAARRHEALRREQLELARAADGLAPVWDVELAVDRLEMRLDGVDRDEQLGRDLLVGHHRRQEAEHRGLPLGERLDEQ